MNGLTRSSVAGIAPVVLGTMFKHFLDKLKERSVDSESKTLRHEEFLYDEVFHIVKRFLEVSTQHTVEEVQDFSNTRTPSPPWVHVVRLIVPMSSCDEAARHLIKALGGEKTARNIVGGIKWWQVRAVRGVDAQWIVAKKDWHEAKKKEKAREKSKATKDQLNDFESPKEGVYQEEMDEMRCILYAHGGGYYFGSVDQERYSLQRHARKINGRVFAVNYRLAPQYPFPCALQDLLAAYLYLIRPPPDASHRPVNPAHIVTAGDSAGGGLTLSLLQVLRDSGLPLPAGAVLISPWCDLTHSFPSIHLNTATDIIPPYGLSIQKPSTLWPPPPDELTTRVQTGLKTRMRHALRLDDPKTHLSGSPVSVDKPEAKDLPINVGATASLPPAKPNQKQTITIQTHSGEVISVDDQVHFYAQNSLISHPLVSSALSYLGGLPPLLFIVSDKEVLRDEGIYAAHKAAHPERFPIRDFVKEMYPALKGIEKKFGATPVHLQVYDDCAHILPVLFAFTTPGKYCYRSIATFTKYVTGIMPSVLPLLDSPGMVSGDSVDAYFAIPANTPPKGGESVGFVSSPLAQPLTQSPNPSLTALEGITTAENGTSEVSNAPMPDARRQLKQSKPRKRVISLNISSVSSITKKGKSISGVPESEESLNSSPTRGSEGSGSFFRRSNSHKVKDSGPRRAGDPAIYSETLEFPSMREKMIRERVSTQGVIRPMEAEEGQDAFKVPEEILGSISELAIRRYLDGKTKLDKKYAGTIKSIEKHRAKSLSSAKKDVVQNMARLQGCLSTSAEDCQEQERTRKSMKEGILAAAGGWSHAWLLDGEEHPPPSSIVSRRDTAEARELARVADFGLFGKDQHASSNHLWAVISNYLTASNSANLEKDNQSDSMADPEPDSVPLHHPRHHRSKRSRISRYLFGASRSAPDVSEVAAEEG